MLGVLGQYLVNLFPGLGCAGGFGLFDHLFGLFRRHFLRVTWFHIYDQSYENVEILQAVTCKGDKALCMISLFILTPAAPAQTVIGETPSLPEHPRRLYLRWSGNDQK